MSFDPLFPFFENPKRQQKRLFCIILIQAFEDAQGCIISHRVRGKVHFEVNAQEGALKCEIRACHFVRFRKNVSKRSVKKNNEGTF